MCILRIRPPTSPLKKPCWGFRRKALCWAKAAPVYLGKRIGAAWRIWWDGHQRGIRIGGSPGIRSGAAFGAARFYTGLNGSRVSFQGEWKMINVGLIGFGYWGPNLARNFNINPDLQLCAVCDFSADRLKTVERFYPQVALYRQVDDFLKNTAMDAVAIATPVANHFDLARQALATGRHVWIEKPMTETVEQAEEIIELALQKNRVLLVDHTFVYTGAVRKIAELISKGELGDLIYYDSTRVNLGLFQQDVNVLWDLAPHDISIIDYLMPFEKLAVSATGSHYYGNSIVPKSLLTIYMEQGVVAHINVSWLSPVKIRQTLIGGNLKMILYNDNEPSEKIKVYDKRVDLDFSKSWEELYQLKVQYRVGDMYAPKLEGIEALTLETQHFADCILNAKKPLTDGKAGLEVVKVLVASEQSLKNRGAPIELR